MPTDPRFTTNRLHTKLGGSDADQQLGIDGRQFIFAGLKERGLNGFDSFRDIWGIDWNLYFDLTGDNDTRVGKNRTQPESASAKASIWPTS